LDILGAVQIARFAVSGPDGEEPRLGVASDAAPDRWIDVRRAYALQLERAGASAAGARRVAAALAPGSLRAALEAGDALFDLLAAVTGTTGDDALIPESARLLAPIDPAAYRDFMAFEGHFVNAIRRLRGPDSEPAAVLYELPVSYFGNAAAIVGPDEEITWPYYSDHMDYELEFGIVIGRPGRDLTPETALEHVLGLTVFNDFSARDIQAQEMAAGLGPSKGKHFGSAVGPRIVTLDALADDLAMTARVNGELWSEGSTGSIMWSIAELVSWASASEPLPAGTLLGSGTVTGGCGLEIGRSLSPGDVVELEIEGIGVLRNRLSARPGSGWHPEPRQRAG
jgi:2-keto-4-pentenoate hydratase/2-oxohepta-3-ene-1,7-dioic acid hydratase in catechol pathway